MSVFRIRSRLTILSQLEFCLGHHSVCGIKSLTVHHLAALSLQGYSGLDGAKGETGAVGSKVEF